MKYRSLQSLVLSVCAPLQSPGPVVLLSCEILQSPICGAAVLFAVAVSSPRFPLLFCRRPSPQTMPGVSGSGSLFCSAVATPHLIVDGIWRIPVWRPLQDARLSLLTVQLQGALVGPERAVPARRRVPTTV